VQRENAGAGGGGPAGVLTGGVGGVRMEDLQRLGVKFFCEEPPGVDLPEFIPVFHRWIQAKGLPELLIDVADYSHVPDGPGILLVAHEGIFGIDETGGRRGLVHYRRQPSGGTLADRLAAVTKSALTVCQKLADETDLGDGVRFRGDELRVFANDRLHAPNTPATLAQFKPALATLLGRLYPGADCAVRPESDAKERFSVTVTGPEPVSVSTLLGRLST